MDPQTPSPSSSPSQSRDIGIAGNDQPSFPTSSPELPTASQHSSPSDLGPDPSPQQQQQQQQQQQHPRHHSDVERHPKGKRKRTLAKDKSVLEAAYTANPKPDKAARLDIVKRVSLNEKEVQIWFQNRRQNDRRKSRPLSPQEIAALRYGGMQILSSDAISYNSSFSTDIGSTSPAQNLSQSQPEQEQEQERGHEQEQRQGQEHGSSSPPRSEHSAHSESSSQGRQEAARIKAPQETPRRDEAEICFPAGLETVTPVQRDGSESGQQQPTQFLPSSVGYLSNRWNPASSFSTPSTLGRAVADESFKLESVEPSTCSSSASLPQILPLPTSQSSRFRLSLSLEGKAEVVSAIPSPPRFSAPTPPTAELRAFGPVPRPNFQRSRSASSLVTTLPPISALTGSLPVSTLGVLPPCLTRGRSRDVHAWEFCCDAENREDALTAQAKHESSGSAIAAISLLRSTSASGCGSPLQPSSSAKRNAATSKAAPRPEQANKKAKLGRALSSVARLQTNTGLGNKKQTEKAVQSDNEKFKVSMLVSPSGNESDKENWSPDEDGNPCFSFQQPSFTSGISGRRPLPSGTSREDKRNPRRTPGRSVLQEYRSPTFQLSTRANTAPAYGRKPRRDNKHGQSTLDIFEDSEINCPGSPREDEVERFMRGEISPSKKGDAAAVAGLLSLSQGNWR
ncbi:hypothetical protein B0T22DRAFT_87551 [Podospora appendiculata]|uniref:Homeobox domain-containing protein n=1 Tax=Podospora appendiculata TaxID=314037 RepID=A0AAE0XKD4_9PEZI|nr:hypothetical protein B0T22DRAFT_87551 [Podospora appendiculata]